MWLLLVLLKEIAKLCLPPILVRCLQRLRRPASPPVLVYVPECWRILHSSRRPGDWNLESVVQAERAKWDTFCRLLQGTGPLGFSHESDDLTVIRNLSFHNIHITYAYVLALVAHRKTCVSVLDWGGGLGHYYRLGKAVLPEITLDFHCKEVPLMAAEGLVLNPEVRWYTDESCLKRSYDLVMINGSLQYIEDWAGTLRQLARVVEGYLFLSRLPVVDRGGPHVAIQRVYQTEILHQQLDEQAVLQVIASEGLHLVREFVVGDRPHIQGAPAPCELRSWLFGRAQP